MQMMARGGKALYGAPLGILMLEARFPRIPGDMGNATTWPFPVLYRVVRGATPQRVVLNEAEGLLDAFLATAAELVADGAEAITTNCGFLSLFQAELAAHVRVPVATSALIQVPWVQAMLPPGRRVGIITVSAGALTPTPSGRGGGAARHAARRHRGRPRILPGADPRRTAGYGRRPCRRRHPGRRTQAGVAPSRCGRHRAGMHQHAALCRSRCARCWACRSMTSTRWSTGCTPACAHARSARPPIAPPALPWEIFADGLDPQACDGDRRRRLPGVASLRAPAARRPRCVVRRQLFHRPKGQHRASARAIRISRQCGTTSHSRSMSRSTRSTISPARHRRCTTSSTRSRPPRPA